MQTSLQKNSNFPERFRKFIRESGFRSTNEFSHYLGYAHSEKISRLFRSPHHKPSYDTLYDIAIKFPTLSVDWLITGRGSMMLKVQHADATSPNTPKSLSRVTGKPENSNEYIPLYELVSIDSSSKKFWENTENILSLIPKKFGMQDCDLAIHVYGNSMCPIYIPGDVILLKEIKNYNLINYGQTHVIVTEEHRFMKYIMRSKDTTRLLLHSENKHYANIELPKKQILKLFQIQGYLRKTNI